MAYSEERGRQMAIELRIFLGIGVLFYFGLLFHLLHNESIILKYSLSCLISGALFVLFLIFPEIVFSASRLIGVSNPVNAVFLLFAGFAIAMLLSITSIVSQDNGKVRKLTQQIALLEQRIRELEKKE